ncbi:MAG: hypothetical protein RLP44_22130 [Aggregatilineales bacterium]
MTENTHNWQLYGHDWAVDYLRKGMIHQRVRHAYLITGVDQIGKSRLAHEFAKALTCLNDDVAMRPCGVCRSCKKAESGNHPDMLFTETDSTTGSLKIEAIRAVTSQIALKPYETRYRVAFFQHFDHAGGQAQDSLLKTLEEPPPHAILLLLANTLEPILSTITSRAQIIHLRPVAANVIKDVLIKHYDQAPDHAELLGKLSGGRIGWAIQAAQNPDLLDQRTQALDMLDDALKMNRAARFELANDLGRDKETLTLLLDLWLSYWRDVLLLAEHSPVKPCNSDRQIAIEQMLYTINAEETLHAIHATQTVLKQLKTNANPRMALEVMFLDYPGLVR